MASCLSRLAGSSVTFAKMLTRQISTSPQAIGKVAQYQLLESERIDLRNERVRLRVSRGDTKDRFREIEQRMREIVLLKLDFGRD